MTRLSRAFTWVEAVVLFSLVCIAVAILFPVFSPHHKSISQNPCLSNMKQLGFAFEQYIQDNDDQYPVGPGTHRGGGWAGAVFPYIRRSGVYHCEDDPTTVDKSVRPARMPVSYGFNQFLAQSNSEVIAGQSASGIGGATRKLKEPSRTIMLFEVTGSRATITDPDEGGRLRDRTSLAGDGLNLLWYNGANKEYVGGKTKVGSSVFDSARYATGRLRGWDRNLHPLQWMNEPRHIGGANYAFADGHARYCRASVLNIVEDTTDKSFWGQK